MKTILITGSTDGIGKITALEMAKAGHQVYIHGRSQAKVEHTISEIKTASGNENIGGFVADFSDLDQVKAMGAKVAEELNGLDILINNAGVFKAPQSHSKEGYDLRFTVNHLAPFALTEMLLPLLEKSGDARIINLSSAAQAEISYPAMTGQVASNVNAVYAQSKLALTMWSFDLGQQLENMTVIAVNPGSLLNTKMANEAYGQHWSPAEKGSNILLSLAFDEIHKAHNGEYFDNDSGRYNEAHPDAYNNIKIKELLDITHQLIK